MLKLSSVAGNSQRLDGGAMFGNVPRALWSQWAEPDDAGRVELACRAFLVEDGERRVLLETGIGAFFEPRLRERYGVMESEHVLLDSLARLGLSDADIDFVVLSHLHFDHAGGLFARHADGEALRLLFPRARFVVGSAAFERARSPHLRDRASFIPELPALLESSGRLSLVTPGEQPPGLPRETFHFRESFGHTVGMLHTTVRGARGVAFFAADLVPGSPWVHLPVSMGYDRYPELLIDEKRSVYEELIADDGHLLFTHDSSVAAARLERSDRGRYAPRAAQADFRGWDLDVSAAPLATSTR